MEYEYEGNIRDAEKQYVVIVLVSALLRPSPILYIITTTPNMFRGFFADRV